MPYLEVFRIPNKILSFQIRDTIRAYCGPIRASRGQEDGDAGSIKKSVNSVICF